MSINSAIFQTDLLSQLIYTVKLQEATGIPEIVTTEVELILKDTLVI